MSYILLLTKEVPEYKEFVVLTNEDIRTATWEYIEDGYHLEETIELEEDLTSWPTDRALRQ